MKVKFNSLKNYLSEANLKFSQMTTSIYIIYLFVQFFYEKKL